MNEEDKKIRKQWLMTLILSMLLSIFNIVLQLRFDPLFNELPLLRYGVTAFSLLGLFVFSYMAYHCIYKKPGTKLLTVLLIVTAVSLAVTPFLYLSGRMSSPFYIPYYELYLLATQGIGVWWAIVCWRMRKVNKKLQAPPSSSG